MSNGVNDISYNDLIDKLTGPQQAILKLVEIEIQKYFFFDYKEIKKYVDLVPHNYFSKCISDVKIIKIKGYKNPSSAPIQIQKVNYEKWFNSRHSFIPTMLIFVLYEIRKTIDESHSIVKTINKRLGAKVPESYLSFEKFKVISKDKFISFSKNYNQADVLMIMLICGIIVSDDKKIIKKINFINENIYDEGSHADFLNDLQEVQSYCSNSLKIYIDRLNILKKMLQYLPGQNNYVVKNDLLDLSKPKGLFKSLKHLDLENDDLIREFKKNNDHYHNSALGHIILDNLNYFPLSISEKNQIQSMDNPHFEKIVNSENFVFVFNVFKEGINKVIKYIDEKSYKNYLNYSSDGSFKLSKKKINEIKKFSIGHEINYNLNTTLNIINSKNAELGFLNKKKKNSLISQKYILSDSLSLLKSLEEKLKKFLLVTFNRIQENFSENDVLEWYSTFFDEKNIKLLKKISETVEATLPTKRFFDGLTRDELIFFNLTDEQLIDLNHFYLKAKKNNILDIDIHSVSILLSQIIQNLNSGINKADKLENNLSEVFINIKNKTKILSDFIQPNEIKGFVKKLGNFFKYDEEDFLSEKYSCLDFPFIAKDLKKIEEEVDSRSLIEIRSMKKVAMEILDQPNRKPLRKKYLNILKNSSSLDNLKQISDQIHESANINVKKDSKQIRPKKNEHKANFDFLIWDDLIYSLFSLNSFILKTNFKNEEHKEQFLFFVNNYLTDLDTKSLGHGNIVLVQFLIEELYKNINQYLIINYVMKKRIISEGIAKQIYFQSLCSEYFIPKYKNDIRKNITYVFDVLQDQYTQLKQIVDYNFLNISYKIIDVDSNDAAQQNKINDYFNVDKGKYSYISGKISAQDIDLNEILNNMMQNIVDDFYQPILSGIGYKMLIKSKLDKLTTESLWRKNRKGADKGYSNLRNNQRQIIEGIFNPIIKDLKNILVNKNNTIIKEKNEKLLFKNNFSKITHSVVSSQAPPIFSSFSPHQSDDENLMKKILDKISEYVMRSIEFQKNQPSIYALVYKSHVDAMEDLYKNWNHLEKNYHLNNYLDENIYNEFIHRNLKNDDSTKTKDFRKLFGERDKTFNSDLAQVKSKEILNKAKALYDVGRMGLAEKIISDYLDEQLVNTEIDIEKLKESKYRFKKALARFASIKIEHNKYFSELSDYEKDFFKILNKSGATIDQIDDCIIVINTLIDDLKKNEFDKGSNYFDLLDEKFNSSEDSSIDFWNLSREISSDSESKDEIISKLQNDIDIKNIFLNLQKLRGKSIIPKSLRFSGAVNGVVEKTPDLKKVKSLHNTSNAIMSLVMSLAKVFGCYINLKDDQKRCLQFGAFNKFPILVTSSLKRLQSNQRMVFAFIQAGKKNRETIENKHLKYLESYISNVFYDNREKEQGILNKNAYAIILIAIGRKTPDEYVIKNNKLFDTMTILNIKNIIDIFYSNNDPQQNFKQKLIKSFPLSENNPYNTADPYDSSHEIFVNRETVNTVLNGQGNYALYGGRRIGKTSICKEVMERVKNKSDSEAFFISCSTYEFEPGSKNNYFREGLQIAEVLVKTINKGEMIRLDSFSLVKDTILDVYNRHYSGKKIIIIFDEFDRYIECSNRETKYNKETNFFNLINQFRHTHQEQKNIRFIYAGFVHLYNYANNWLVDEEVRAAGSNHWHGHVEPLQINNLNRENARKLVLSLETSLALEFDNKEFVEYILNNTGNHPAFIQGFCKRLVDQISNRINQNDRKIYIQDIENVLVHKKEDENGNRTYFGEVEFTIKTNFQYTLENRQYNKVADAILTIINMIDEQNNESQGISKGIILDELNYFLNEHNVKLEREEFDKAITVLRLNFVLREKDGDYISSTYSFWKQFYKFSKQSLSSSQDADPDWLKFEQAAKQIDGWRNNFET